MPKVSFVTNMCPHYRVKTFAILASYYDVSYYFYSAGDEWYWQTHHGVKGGEFKYEYLPGFSLGKTRITPSLPLRLWRENRDVYIKCINGRFALPTTYLVAKMRGKPFILYMGIWTRITTAAHRLLFPVTRYIYRRADAVVVYGEHVKRYLVGEGVPEERIFVAYHAIENSDYNQNVPKAEVDQLRQQLGIPPGNKIVLYLGRLEPNKGLDDLLNAYALMKRKDISLVIAGTGSQETKLKEMSRELGISNQVLFVGYIPTDKTVAYYAAAWVYVLPSRSTPQGNEAWGLVVNEAFNQGIPVIATDAVGAATKGGLVKDGINGLVVPEDNPEELASALRLIIGDDELRNQMSNNAREIIVSWDNERMVSGFRSAIGFVTSRQKFDDTKAFEMR